MQAVVSRQVVVLCRSIRIDELCGLLDSRCKLLVMRSHERLPSSFRGGAKIAFKVVVAGSHLHRAYTYVERQAFEEEVVETDVCDGRIGSGWRAGVADQSPKGGLAIFVHGHAAPRFAGTRGHAD